MNDVILLLTWNLAIMAMLALGVWCLGWLPAMRRRPALRHGLWLLVLLKLVVPPLVPVPVLSAGLVPVSADRAPVPVVGTIDRSSASPGDAMVDARAIPNQSAETAESARDLSSAVEGQLPAREVAGAAWFGWREALIVLVGLSLSVSAALWLAAVRQVRRVRRHLKNGPVQSGRVALLLDETAREFSLRRVPRLLLADAPVTPMLWADRGRPAIVLPRQLIGLVDDDQLRWILGHELAHCVRRDHLANLLAFVIVSLFWWNPVAWFARRELASAAEAACDALTLARLSGSRKSYAETLLAVIDFLSRANSPDLAIGVGFGRSRSLKARFVMLARRGVRPGISRVGWGVIALGAVGLALLPARAEYPSKAVAAPAAEAPLPKVDFPPTKPAPPPADAQPTRPYEVTVGDVRGRAVAGADVWFTTVWSLFPQQELALAGYADDAGHFRFSVPDAWLSGEFGCVVWAYAPGHGVGMASPSSPREKGFPDKALTIQLRRASDLSVAVTLPDGKPAVGAKVAPLIYGLGPHNVVFVPAAVSEKIGGVTDQQGRAKLPALAREHARKTAVVHQGYGQQFFFLQQRNRGQNGSRAPDFVFGEPELRLRPAGRIEGRLIANQSELVSGIAVKFDQENAAFTAGRSTADYLTGWGTAEVTTDAEGRFVIPAIAEGRAELSIKFDRRLPIRPRVPDFEVKGGETLKLEIPWEMGVRVHGTVRVKDGGEPLKEIFLKYGPAQFEGTTTDDKGNFSGLVLPGDIRVLAMVGNAFTDLAGKKGKTYAVPKGVADFELPPIEAAPAIEITGTLLDAEGKPLVGARISGIADGESYGGHDSDEQGKFSLGRFPVGMTFDSFSIESDGRHFYGKAESTDPLVVRLQPKAAQVEGTEKKR